MDNMAYTTIDDSSAHFYSYAFTKSSGTGSETFDGNSDLQPDFLWVKSRTNADAHELWDSTRGVNSTLFSHNTEAEDTSANRIVSFDTDGFTWGNAGNLNAAGDFVSWAWKANGGTTSSNTDGSLTSTVQANTDAGFSIVTYTNAATGNKTVGHGLGVKPDMIIFKNLGTTIDWHVAHKDLTNYTTYGLTLNTTASQAIYTNAMNNTEPTSSVFSIGGIDRTGSNGNEVVAYCFASKQGFSNFGKYTGNGSSNGPFVYIGFKPSFVVLKRINAANNWFMYDVKRDGYNESQLPHVKANQADAESQTNNTIDILSNGFKIKGGLNGTNGSSGTYIYMAFAENPFVTSTGIPTTAR